jgi:hypothetical protein
MEQGTDAARQQMIQDLKMDSQRWQQERQPGEARGGSHSPYLRDTKVSRGPDASLVAYQDSRTHAARQHWGPTKPYDQPTEPYEAQPRQSTSSRTAYPSSGYASSDAHYTTTPTSYAGSHSGYQAAPTSAAPRTAPVDPYSSAYPQSVGREYAAPSAYSSYPVQPSSDYGRSTAPPTGQYAAPRYFGHFDPYLLYR